MPSGAMKIVSIAISEKKGTRKNPVGQGLLMEGHGFAKDAHAGPWHRQVSLLPSESIAMARGRGLDVGCGDFGENIATEGVCWDEVPVGARFRLGEKALIEITQKGKVCHRKCAIFFEAGDCIMPREGVFGKVLRGGPVRAGDPMERVEDRDG